MAKKLSCFERLFCLLLLLEIATVLPAQSAHQLQRKGDQEYQQSKYREAEEAYRQAGAKKQDDPRLRYNTGNAIYQQGNYPASESYFEQAAQAANDPSLKADALHNLGNARLKQQKYREAAEAYENSLRLRPGDPETKTNLQLARKKWRQQQQEEQQQQQQQQNQSSGQQNQPNPNQPNPNPEQNQAPPQQPSQGQQPQEQPSEGNMTREQARRLLETAVKPEDQKNARKYRELEPGKHQTQPKKDW